MGLATAKLLASRGAIISLADINEAAVRKAAESLDGDRHIYAVVDVRHSQKVDGWIQDTVRNFGKLDGAVNMAGIISPAQPVTEISDETWDFNFAVNTRGVFFCLRAQLKAMKPGASIVSIPTRHWTTSKVADLPEKVSAASTFGQMGSPGVSPYCASKAAVIGLSRAAAKENQHIRINCVAPGKLITLEPKTIPC